MAADGLLVVHDVADAQLVTGDGRMVGRVADVRLVQEGDDLVMLELVVGPGAMARRVSSRLGRLVHGSLRRFERVVALGEVKRFGLDLELRGTSADYDLADGDDWARALIRHIPGSGSDPAEARPKGHRLPPTASGDAATYWLADLMGTPVRDPSGRELGHVRELRAGLRTHRIRTILTGRSGWFGRLGIANRAEGPSHVQRHEEIAWDRVAQVNPDEILLRR
jgi:sporulation protein YlmC with PRC-barrel domain